LLLGLLRLQLVLQGLLLSRLVLFFGLLFGLDHHLRCIVLLLQLSFVIAVVVASG